MISDKRRREMMLPPRLMLMICRSALPDQAPEDTAMLMEIIEDFERCLDEPCVGVDADKRRRLRAAVEREAHDLCDELFGRPLPTAMRAIAYLIQRIIDEGNIDLTEWPMFMAAYSRFTDMIHNDGRSVQSLNDVRRSARRVADRQWAWLQRREWYRVQGA